MKLNDKRPGEYRVLQLKWVSTELMTELSIVYDARRPEFRFSESYLYFYLFCQTELISWGTEWSWGNWACPSSFKGTNRHTCLEIPLEMMWKMRGIQHGDGGGQSNSEEGR